MRRIRVIDSHTEGEPTRVVVDGLPDLGSGPASERRAIFRDHFDAFRSAVVNEPRGHDAVVGALLLEPQSSDAVGQVVFFNNVGVLHGCIHGTIGVAATLAHLGRIDVGYHTLETPVGDVTIDLADDGLVSVENVRSFRHEHDVVVKTERYGEVRGDIAWGGNWFFLVEHHDQDITFANIDALTEFTWDVRRALGRNGITGADGGEIDHVEIFGPPEHPDADSKNFVLCPGRAYDRSPCGTGTSAKLACLAASGKLDEGKLWRQESIVGSVFHGCYRAAEKQDCGVIPTVSGRAWITAESTLLVDPTDPFGTGIRC